jgi:hypothetical protein
MLKVLGVAGLFAFVGCASQSGEQRPAARSEASTSEAAAPQPDSISPDRQDAIERVFARKAGELQQCWSAEYEKNHNRKLEGDVTIGMDIAPTGTPGNIRLLKSTIGNTNIEGCVTQQIATWSFPEGPSSVPYMRTVHLGAQY